MGPALAVAYGAVLFVNGAGLALLAVVHRIAAPGLVPFAFAVALHGLRSLSASPELQALVALSPSVAAYIGPLCLYWLAVASHRFLFLFWGRGLFGLWALAWRFFLVFAVVATIADLAAGPGASLGVYRSVYYVSRLVTLATILTFSIEYRPTDRAVLAGMGVVLVCTLYDAYVPPAVAGGFSARPLCVVAVCAGIAYALLRRVRLDPQALVALSTELDAARQVQRALRVAQRAANIRRRHLHRKSVPLLAGSCDAALRGQGVPCECTD